MEAYSERLNDAIMIRATAALALGEIQARIAKSYLENLLIDESVRVRAAAMISLAKIDPLFFTAQFNQLSIKDDNVLQHTAVKVTEEIFSSQQQDEGFDSNQLKNWMNEIKCALFEFLAVENRFST